MTRLRHLVVAVAVPALILVVFAVSTALAAPQGKVTVCHHASQKYVQISVSGNAVPAHMGHGDVMPDEYGDCPS